MIGDENAKINCILWTLKGTNFLWHIHIIMDVCVKYSNNMAAVDCSSTIKNRFLAGHINANSFAIVSLPRSSLLVPFCRPIRQLRYNFS